MSNNANPTAPRASAPLTVSQLARLSGVSVRTLHHYDEIGLFCAHTRTSAGYRLYTHDDVERLQQILFFRELGFPLDEIRRIVSDATFDVGAALVMQRRLLVDKIAHLHRILGAVDHALARNHGEPMSTSEPSGKPATPEELFEVFGRDVHEHDGEAKQRWGDTTEFQESARRTAEHSREDWAQIKAEQDEIFADLAALLKRGVAAAAAEASAVAERHRQHVCRWFYQCSREVHAGLGAMYAQDPRFAATFDAVSPGLSAYASAAWQANAARQAPVAEQ
jgi:MerR family transcriptional regulator, thiopeptide resistance regulator